MLYCENCMLLCNGDACKRCDTKALRAPKENDPVFLIEKEALWCGGMEETFRTQGIPCLKKGWQGAGITERLGYVTETYAFYVPFGAYEKAKALLNDIYGADTVTNNEPT